MGRRARQRAAADPAAPAPRRRPAPGRERALDRLSPARRVLAIYVVIAMAIAVAVILGIALLGGTLGPFLVAAYAIVGAGLAHRWARARLAPLTLGDDDRMMQTMAGGLLVLSVGFAIASLVVVAVT